MNLKFALSAVLVVAVIAIGSLYFINRVTHVFGTVSPSDITATNFTEVTASNGIYIGAGGLTVNGLFTENTGVLKTSVNATTTPASLTIKSTDLNGYDTVILTPTVASVTITFPASSTLSTWLPTVGNAQDTCFINGTTTSAIVITFAGGTGTLLQVASSSATALGAVTLYPQKMGCFHFTRSNATATTFDIIAAYTAFQ